MSVEKVERLLLLLCSLLWLQDMFNPILIPVPWKTRKTSYNYKLCASTFLYLNKFQRTLLATSVYSSESSFEHFNTFWRACQLRVLSRIFKLQRGCQQSSVLCMHKEFTIKISSSKRFLAVLVKTTIKALNM